MSKPLLPPPTFAMLTEADSSSSKRDLPSLPPLQPLPALPPINGMKPMLSMLSPLPPPPLSALGDNMSVLATKSAMEMTASASLASSTETSSADINAPTPLPFPVSVPASTKGKTKEGDPSQSASLYIFAMDDPIRKVCRKIADSAEFRWTVLFVIFCNCITLVLQSQFHNDDTATGYLEIGDNVFLALFSIECIVKVISYGFVFCGPGSYIRSYWNGLDFVVVALGFLNFSGSVANFTFIRTLRVLRPLKAISGVPGMRIMVSAVLQSIPQMINVVMLLFFMLALFALIGLQLFDGQFRQRCFNESTGKLALPETMCTTDPSVFLGSQGVVCGVGQFCADQGFNTDLLSFDSFGEAFITCVVAITGEGWTVYMYDGWDTMHRWVTLYFIFMMLLIYLFVMQLVVAVLSERFSEAKEAEEQKRLLMAARRESNVRRAVVAGDSSLPHMTGGQRRSLAGADMEALARFAASQGSRTGGGTVTNYDSEDRRGNRTRTGASDDGITQRTGPSMSELKDSHVSRRADPTVSAILDFPSVVPQASASARRSSAAGASSNTDELFPAKSARGDQRSSRLRTGESGIETEEEDDNRTRTSRSGSQSGGEGSGSGSEDDGSGSRHRHRVNKRFRQRLGSNAAQLGERRRSVDKGNVNGSAPADSSSRRRASQSGIAAAGTSAESENAVSGRRASLDRPPVSVVSALDSEVQHMPNVPQSSDHSAADIHDDLPNKQVTREGTLDRSNSGIDSEWTDDQMDEEEQDRIDNMSFGEKLIHGIYLMQLLKFIQSMCISIIRWKWWQRVSVSCVLGNTVVLSIHHYGIPDHLGDNLDFANTLFTWFFIIEMGITIIALGIRNYVRNSSHLFDGFVVSASIYELIITSSGGGTGGGGAISALRALRLFRLVRLLRSWKSMYQLLQAIVASISDLGYFMLLMMLFLFITALAANTLFRDKMYFKGIRARNHFDTFGWAMITMFQVMTPENFDQVMRDVIRAGGYGGGVFMIFVMIIGHYLVETLFLVIIVSNFEDEPIKADDGTNLTVMQKLKRWWRRFLRKQRRRAEAAQASNTATLSAPTAVNTLSNAKPAPCASSVSAAKRLFLPARLTPVPKFAPEFMRQLSTEIAHLFPQTPRHGLPDPQAVSNTMSPTIASLDGKHELSLRTPRVSNNSTIPALVVSPLFKDGTVIQTLPLDHLQYEQSATQQMMPSEDVVFSPRSNASALLEQAKAAESAAHRQGTVQRQSTLQRQGTVQRQSTKQVDKRSQITSLFSLVKVLRGPTTADVEEDAVLFHDDAINFLPHHHHHLDAEMHKRWTEAETKKKPPKVPPPGESGSNSGTPRLSRRQTLGETGSDSEGSSRSSSRPSTAGKLSRQSSRSKLNRQTSGVSRMDRLQATLRKSQTKDSTKSPLSARVSIGPPRNPRQQKLPAASWDPTKSTGSSSCKTPVNSVSAASQFSSGSIKQLVISVIPATPKPNISSSSSIPNPPLSVDLSAQFSPTRSLLSPSNMLAPARNRHQAAARRRLSLARARFRASLLSGLASPLNKKANNIWAATDLAKHVETSKEKNPRSNTLSGHKDGEFSLKSSNTIKRSSSKVSSDGKPERSRTLSRKGTKTGNSSDDERSKADSSSDEEDDDDFSDTQSEISNAESDSMSILNENPDDLSPDEIAAQINAGDDIDLMKFSPQKSFFLLKRSHWLRRFCIRLQSHWLFEDVVLACILFSCALMALDSPSVIPDSPLEQFIGVTDLVLVYIFIFEMAVKVIAQGLILHDDSYFRSNWNILDGFVVLTSIASLIAPDLKLFRILRVFRPLRVISRFTTTRLVVTSITASLPKVINVLLFMSLVFLVLSILGVQFFEGVMQRCMSPDGKFTLPLDKVACFPPNVWGNPVWMGNFDSVPDAFLVMFELATEENWPTIMYAFVDARQPGQSPLLDNNQAVGFFFCICIFLNSFFVKDLFIGVVVDTYNSYYAFITGASNLTAAQKQWLDLYKMMVDNPPPIRYLRPYKPWLHRWDLKMRQFTFQIVTHPKFELGSLMLILINVVFLMMHYYDQPHFYGEILDLGNAVITLMFVGEMLLKLIAVGRSQYFALGWNQFDAAVTMLGLLEFLASQGLLSIAFLGFNPTLLRVLRLMRVLRLIRHLKTIQQLIRTLTFSIPSMLNVGLLVLLLFFCYSVLGMYMFGHLKATNSLDSHAHFRDFITSFITLFRCMTGENWNGIMRDCMIAPPFCSESLGDCGSPVWAPLYWVSFQILTAFLLVNVVIAVVLQIFEDEMEKESARGTDSEVDIEDFELFGRVWTQFEPSLTMPVAKVMDFINELPPDLGLKGEEMRTSNLIRYLDELQLPCDGERVHYLDLLYRLSWRVFIRQHTDYDDEDYEPDENESTTSSERAAERARNFTLDMHNAITLLIRAQVYREFPELNDPHRWRYKASSVGYVIMVQRMWRGIKARRAIIQKRREMFGILTTANKIIGVKEEAAVLDLESEQQIESAIDEEYKADELEHVPVVPDRSSSRENSEEVNQDDQDDM